MQEIWKDIPEFIGIYQVSNLGRVKSLARQKGFMYCNKDILLKQKKDKYGYLTVNLKNKGCGIYRTVHRLVMFAFKGESKLQVNHIDTNKINNCLSNLEYCNQFENMRHAVKNNLIKTEKKVICHETGQKFRSISDAGRKMQLSRSAIADVVNKRKHNKTVYGYTFDFVL